jgi:hypothetical protein
MTATRTCFRYAQSFSLLTLGSAAIQGEAASPEAPGKVSWGPQCSGCPSVRKQGVSAWAADLIVTASQS